MFTGLTYSSSQQVTTYSCGLLLQIPALLWRAALSFSDARLSPHFNRLLSHILDTH